MAAARGSGSYYEEYMRSNALLKHGGDRNARQLLTDRNAYISFLEVQLERVSAACLSAQTFEKRLGEVEAAQIANDQKVSSLSKVFRLNQEYLEQTTEQSRAELAAVAAKMDSWMDKLSCEAGAHETRLTQCEEQFRRCDDFVQALSDQTQREVDSVRSVVEREVSDLKTLVFAADARLESMHNAQGDAEQHMEVLRRLVADRLDEDLGRVRTSLSEKYLAIEEKQERLMDNVKEFVSGLESSWRSDLAREHETRDERWNRLRDQLDRTQHESVADTHEMKEILRKCLDAQHLLSATVVRLQNEVDERHCDRKAGLSSCSRHTDIVDRDPAHQDEVDHLRENQRRLKEAVRVLQTCTQDAQQRNEEYCERLADRLNSAEQQFAALAHQSLDKAEEMRTNVLIALGEVEQKLRQDADAVAEQAVQSVRSETEHRSAKLASVVASIDERLQLLEACVQEQSESNVHKVHVRIPSNKSYGEQPYGVEILGSHRYQEQKNERADQGMEQQMRDMVTALRQDVAHQASRERELVEHIRDLENKLRASSLREEDQNAIVPDRRSIGKITHPASHPILRHSSLPRPASSSSSSSEPLRQDKRQPANTKGKPSVAPKTVAKKPITSMKATPLGIMSTAKASRLKELCLELVALEGSLKKNGIKNSKS